MLGKNLKSITEVLPYETRKEKIKLQAGRRK